jgi:uncharacterized protein involved in exopolysaccharide biosynthesis
LYFIRLFSKHLFLILSIPVVLAALVYFFTKNEPRTYASKATVYTSLASGSSIDLSSMKLNTVNTAFDNLMMTIKSRETIEDVGLKLFTSHLLLDKPDELIIQTAHYQVLKQNIPAEIKELKVANNFEKTYANLLEFNKKTKSNYLTNLLQGDNAYYGTTSISGKLKVKRMQSSDNLELSYESDDPGICQNTLIYLIESFKKNYFLQKASESNDAVAYYEIEVAKAAEKLKISEDELLVFNQENKIINYSEQSKFIAARKESFESGYQDVLKQNASAKAIIELLENKMSPLVKQKITGTNVLALRKQLGDVNQKLALATILNESEDKNLLNQDSNYQKLTQKAYELKEQMRQSVDSLYTFNNSTEGIPTNNILSDWLTNVIDYEGTQAQLITMNELRKDFEEIYAKYAPMGANMRRLERKISVNEDEYISLIKNLGLAKLKQQGVETSSGFTVLDEPIFPILPEADKRTIMVLAAAVVGLFLTLFTILVVDLLDPSLRNAFRAQIRTGLLVDAIFPIISTKKQRIDLPFVETKSVEFMARKLLFKSQTLITERRPILFILLSTGEKEGKSFLAERIVSQFNRMRQKAIWLHPPMDNLKSTETSYNYEITNDFGNMESLSDIHIIDKVLQWELYSIVVLELPGIINFSYPIQLIKSADHCFLVCRANRSWSSADSNIMDEILQLRVENKPTVLLTGVALDEMESVLGDLPRKRSWLRRLVKGVASHQSRTKSIT